NHGCPLIQKPSDKATVMLEPKTASLDVLSTEYAALWPGGEAWCQELEVYHNPMASHPIDFELVPGATHWFEKDGVIQCEAYFECSVMSSVTRVQLGVPPQEGIADTNDAQ
ncbi:MAG: hypothetical protein GEV13_34060, partial [Rhodospirillales bacterium]|nr:hypothetical protein [Rhodospirillales bacterium]